LDDLLESLLSPPLIRGRQEVQHPFHSFVAVHVSSARLTDAYFALPGCGLAISTIAAGMIVRTSRRSFPEMIRLDERQLHLPARNAWKSVIYRAFNVGGCGLITTDKQVRRLLKMSKEGLALSTLAVKAGKKGRMQPAKNLIRREGGHFGILRMIMVALSFLSLLWLAVHIATSVW
jgi:hypothetical protein